MKVFLNGKFDVLHCGHFNLLSYARVLAGRHGKVTVAIDTKRRIIETTGKEPIFGELDRCKTLTQLRYPFNDTLLNLVDGVYFFDSEEELRELITLNKPMYLLKGSEWKEREVIGSDLTNLIFYNSDYEFHSTDIVKRILERHAPKN